MASENPNELKVWVDGYQRCICGITETTTVQEVVIALAQAVGQTGRYTLVEKWRSTERLLPPQECPLALLQKWGLYKKDIQFILRRSDKSSSGQSNNSSNSHRNHQNSTSNSSGQPNPHQPVSHSQSHNQSHNHHHQNTTSLSHNHHSSSNLPSNYNNLNQSSYSNNNNSHPVRRNNSNLVNHTLPSKLQNQYNLNNSQNGQMNNRKTNTLPSPGNHHSHSMNQQQQQIPNKPGHNHHSPTLNRKQPLNSQISNPILQNSLVSKKHQEHVNKIQQDMEQHARQEYHNTMIKQEQSLKDIENEINKFNQEIMKLRRVLGSRRFI